MRTRELLMLVVAAALIVGCAGVSPSLAVPKDPAALREQVFATERAFARTMADRDFAAFTTFISDEAIFFSGKTPVRGKAAVVADWKRFYESKEAPFRWEPSEVVVLDSGNLALSTGPVHDPAGKEVATFTSIWRQDGPGVWHIVFDKGNAACNCARP